VSRVLEPLPVPTGEALLEVLPALRAALTGSGPALLPVPLGSNPPEQLAPGQELAPSEDDPADPTVAVVSTSGSTGEPKGTLLPAAALLASASATHDRLGGPGRWLLALPAQHIAGFQVLVRSLITGTTPVPMDLSTGFGPEGFAAAVGRLTGPRRYTALVPTQLSRLLAAGGSALDALTSLDGVLVGGSATPAPLRDRALAAGVRLVTTYGMSETCGGCVYDGVPLDGVEVDVDVDDGGRISLGGPMVARGYRGRPMPGPSGPSFTADPSGRRWFRTDDVGHLSGGRLVVGGRLDDVLITGGLKVAPGVIEAALLRLPGVAEAVVVGADDPDWGQRVVAAIVLQDGATAPSLDTVRDAVRTDVAAYAAPRQLLVLDRLPLRGPGKPDRDALARQAMGG
jgi:O-succinylbenzoic acid--CoA ligase